MTTTHHETLQRRVTAKTLMADLLQDLAKFVETGHDALLRDTAFPAIPVHA
jgi:hypothetical protein